MESDCLQGSKMAVLTLGARKFPMASSFRASSIQGISKKKHRNSVLFIWFFCAVAVFRSKESANQIP